MRFAVGIVSGPGYVHSAAFKETAETLHYGLRALGHDSLLTTKMRFPGRRVIVLGSHLLADYPQPLDAEAILYNLEQVSPDNPWIRDKLLDLFRRHTVWDYSDYNARVLAGLGIKVAHVVPLGYAPELTRIAPADVEDIDVLFYGCLNARRERVLETIARQGLQVRTLFGVYGAERDALIARSKLVLNVHFYDAKVLEMTRIGYLLANRRAVLSERSSDPFEDAALDGAVAFAHYEGLAQRARDLVDRPDERARLASRGFELMRARPVAAYLKPAVGS
jgi:hypothetical protein